MISHVLRFCKAGSTEELMLGAADAAVPVEEAVPDGAVSFKLNGVCRQAQCN